MIPALSLFALLAAATPVPALPPQTPPREKEVPPDQSQRQYATLVVEVKDEEGKAVENAAVSLDNAGGTTERAGSTGESGFVQLVLVKAGNYFVRVRLKGYAPDERAVKLEADKRADLVFVLRKAKA